MKGELNVDFCQIKERSTKNGIEVYPDFKVCRSKDLMVRGKSFYAIWDEEKGLWSTDEYDVPRMIDAELYAKADNITTNGHVIVKTMSDFSSKSWMEFRTYISHVSDSSHQLDEKIVFSNTDVKKTDYVSKRLSYPLEKGDISAYEQIISTLYDPEERAKLEWSIGAIISGDSKSIQKFIVLYGEAGAGKSTVLNIIQKLFDGYYTTFEAKALTTSSNAFATEVFKANPLVAIQHDGDLSRIEDNTKLNSIVSHEEIIINEKYKSSYPSKINCFLYMATNRPVKITDAKSGIIRRLIDVKPSGRKLPPEQYNELISQIDFELGGIAYHCLEVYKSMGKNYYSTYRPVDMMYKTDPFFNFVEDCYDVFKREDGTSLKAAYAMYKIYCDDTNADYKLQMYKFREELKNYFSNFEDVRRIDDKIVRSYYSGFLTKKFDRVNTPIVEEPKRDGLVLECTESIFDKICKDLPAQYANKDDIPSYKWNKVNTKLHDIDTTKVHYVKVPINHIVIDFDLKDKDGNKSMELNLNAASKFPPTYAEFSKGGAGVHLHYIYTGGDPCELSRIYDENIEIKVFNGGSALRRRLSKCNNLPIANISSGLPLKSKGETVVNFDTIKNEKALRTLILRNLNKEIHPGTKPSIDFIEKILSDAYNSGMHYDVTNMRQAIQNFAACSTNHSDYCLKACMRMKYKSDDASDAEEIEDDRPIVFYDIEVFPNLLLINWKREGEHNVVRMINPSPTDVEELLKMKLVGFNCRKYDNHILYARMMGYSIAEIYRLSQRIIKGDRDAFFGEAYNISYTDIYDFVSKKQSLKKYEIELGIRHLELGLPWDKPVPEEMWAKVAEYCDNDVISTEAVWNSKKVKADFEARKALAKITGGSVNDTTNTLTTRLIFEGNRHPQDEFVYTDLSKDFSGYVYKNGKSSYRDVEEVGEGGYVCAYPGMYKHVVTFDVASMHPHSVIALNLFGDRYTKRFEELVHARIAIKHKDVEVLKTIFDGAFAEYVDASDEELKNLAQALKIAINSVYGLTAAKFDNPFRDPRNIDNIVAKRGALFMINLRHEVQSRGGTVVHIKTDSIKIENPTKEIWDFVMDYGKQYGYTFEVEHVFEKICLVNNAVYIAKLDENDPDDPGKWTATGTQFAVPYVFKTLFTKEPIEFKDLCETKEVKSSMYLDMNETLADGEHDYHFIGKVGSFCPVVDGSGGGILLRDTGVNPDDYPKVSGSNGKEKITTYDMARWAAVTGTKGYRWMEAEMVKQLNKEDSIDISYYERLANDAINTMAQFGDVTEFINN